MAKETEISLTKEFEGIHDGKMDAKGRITIPAEFRALMGEPRQILLMRTTHEPCLSVIPIPSVPPQMDERARYALAPFKRTVEIEQSGRINIPLDFQRAMLGIGNEKGAHVNFVGRGDHFEIWTRENWQSHESAELEEAAKASAHYIKPAHE